MELFRTPCTYVEQQIISCWPTEDVFLPNTSDNLSYFIGPEEELGEMFGFARSHSNKPKPTAAENLKLRTKMTVCKQLMVCKFLI